MMPFGLYIRTRRTLRPPTSEVFPISTPPLLIFSLEEQRYALRLDHVERVLRAVAVTPLPKAPEIVLGVLDLHGQVIPVVDLRRRFGLPLRDLRTSDQFVIARAGQLTVALPVDATENVQEAGSVVVPADQIVSGTEFLEGVTRTSQGLVMIHDLATLLFPAEAGALALALAEDRA